MTKEENKTKTCDHNWRLVKRPRCLGGWFRCCNKCGDVYKVGK